jgi:CheY-like chemotaxis protein
MPATKKNLLLVEDDAELRILLTAILAQSGFRIRAAADGFSALAEIRAELPDVILSDLFMLGMSGFELLSVVRRRFPAITVIAMSSAFSGGEVPTGVAADAFYQKATSIPSLLRLVAETASPDFYLAKRDGKSAPIWIATHPEESSPDEHVVIACPECLRTFAHAPGKSVAVVRKTDCAYCLTMIHYAIVRTVDPGPAPATWRQTSFPRVLAAGRSRDRGLVAPGANDWNTDSTTDLPGSLPRLNRRCEQN